MSRSPKYQAERFRQKLSDRTVILRLNLEGKIVPKIGAGAEPLSAGEIAVLLMLKPELVNLLKAEAERSKPRHDAGKLATGKNRAPQVSKPAEIVAMIEGLITHPSPDDSDCRELARRIRNDPGFSFNNKDPSTSEDTFFGIAKDTKNGTLARSIMIDAVDECCAPSRENRGDAFIAAVKRMKAIAMLGSKQ